MDINKIEFQMTINDKHTFASSYVVNGLNKLNESRIDTIVNSFRNSLDKFRKANTDEEINKI